MTDHDEMRSLVNAARARDPEAIGAIFDRYYPAIYRYAFARLGNAADAEDVAAETFAAVVRSIGGFRWRGVPFQAWLFRIATSKVVDVARRRQRDRQVPPDAPEPENERADERNPADVVGDRLAGQALVAALEHLAPDQRDVLLLRFFADCSLREVADALGRSEGAIKQLQLRGLRRLRVILDS